MTTNEFNVLLIDDDEDDFVYLKDLFSEVSRNSYKITWKSSYKEGLKALQSFHFDICLLDYRLGEHSGIELLNEVKKLNHACPIIFLTGHADFDLDVQAMQMGAAEFLVKGQLTSPLLERTVRYAMKHSLDMAELRENKAQLMQQDRLASLGLLASSLAHEIGTPMGIIRSRAEMVQKKAATAPLKQDMSTIIAQIDRIAKLVHSLLNLAREKKSEHAVAVDVNMVLEDVLNLFRHELVRKGIELQVSVLPDLVVQAEAGPLSQVLLNLLVNSVHAIEEERNNGRTENHKIEIRSQTTPTAIELFIHDTGCGISEPNLKQLFKPFFTTKDIGHGTGLGLATSFKLVESWGGTLQAQSQRGHGATFRLRLKNARPIS